MYWKYLFGSTGKTPTAIKIFEIMKTLKYSVCVGKNNISKL